MPYDTNRSALTPTIAVSEQATISPASGVAQNFNIPVSYTVTSQSGVAQVWTVTVINALNSENDITAFAITGQVRTVAKVTVDGPFVHLDVVSPFVAGAVSVAYTQPVTVTDRLQDLSLNQAISFTAAAVTNALV